MGVTASIAEFKNRDFIDKLIQERLKNWDISRLAIIDRIILRMSASEMFFIDEVPPKVSIAEGVEIAKVFSTKDSSSFVNGILDAIYNEVYIKDNNPDAGIIVEDKTNSEKNI